MNLVKVQGVMYVTMLSCHALCSVHAKVMSDAAIHRPSQQWLATMINDSGNDVGSSFRKSNINI